MTATAVRGVHQRVTAAVNKPKGLSMILRITSWDRWVEICRNRQGPRQGLCGPSEQALLTYMEATYGPRWAHAYFILEGPDWVTIEVIH